jgi:hypothetical protein
MGRRGAGVGAGTGGGAVNCMSGRDFARALQRQRAAPAGNKFRAQPVTLDGHRFASKAERDCYARLKLRVLAQEIADLELHPRFDLMVNGTGSAATRPTSGSSSAPRGRVRVIDVKSPVTAKRRDFRRACKHLKQQDGIEVEVWINGREPAQ